jgi:hypothetical protein
VRISWRWSAAEREERMTNDENQMTKEARNPNDRRQLTKEEERRDTKREMSLTTDFTDFTDWEKTGK